MMKNHSLLVYIPNKLILPQPKNKQFCYLTQFHDKCISQYAVLFVFEFKIQINIVIFFNVIIFVATMIAFHPVCVICYESEFYLFLSH